MTMNQILALIAVVLSVLMSATSQLSDVFGPTAAKDIVAIAGLLNAVITGIIGAYSGQGSQVRNVLAMPGVEKLFVNEKANQTLASIAVDPAQMKIESTPSAEAKVNQTAKGA